MGPIGPSRPPAVLREEHTDRASNVIGPVMPSTSLISAAAIIGPSHPADSIPEKATDKIVASSPARDFAGPILPPGFRESMDELKRNDTEANTKQDADTAAALLVQSAGPSLPPGFVRKSGGTARKVMGPARPPQAFIDRVAAMENTVVGPLPAQADEAAEAEEKDMVSGI